MRREVPRGRPACPPKSASSVGVPVEVVGRPSRGEGRVPGGAGVVEVGKGCVEVELVVLAGFRGVERLRKDIFMSKPEWWIESGVRCRNKTLVGLGRGR